MRYLVTAIVTLEHVDYFAPKETVIIHWLLCALECYKCNTPPINLNKD